MEPREVYTSKDFRRHAKKEFASDFAEFRDAYVCIFERKTYFDENTAHDFDALIVGHYHRREFGPPVWAQATSTGVRYYQGKATEQRVYPIPDMHISRIYFEERYSSLVGTQKEASHTLGRKPGHFIIETVINVLFLLTGRLEQISNPYNVDMLSNFKHVCKTIASKANDQQIVIDSARRLEGTPDEALVERVSKKRKRTARDRSPGSIKQEVDSDTEHQGPHPRNPILQLLPHHSPIPYRPSSNTPHSSLVEHIRSYEIEMQTKSEREKQEHDAELKEVQAKLLVCKTKLQCTEGKNKRQKEYVHFVEEKLKEQKLRGQRAEEALNDKEICARTFEEELEQQKVRARTAEKKVKAQEIRIQALEDDLQEQCTLAQAAQEIGRENIAEEEATLKQLARLNDELTERDKLLDERGQCMRVLEQKLAQQAHNMKDIQKKQKKLEDHEKIGGPGQQDNQAPEEAVGTGVGATVASQGTRRKVGYRQCDMQSVLFENTVKSHLRTDRSVQTNLLACIFVLFVLCLPLIGVLCLPLIG